MTKRRGAQSGVKATELGGGRLERSHALIQGLALPPQALLAGSGASTHARTKTTPSSLHDRTGILAQSRPMWRRLAQLMPSSWPPSAKMTSYKTRSRTHANAHWETSQRAAPAAAAQAARG
mmetsp:Transcript_12111/g.34263  ORF Transcript_12111/g.34263 Transcript_12111/m.34263 type:complete len:121 (-) Transcript_12111:893-1255(-)